MNNLYQTLNPKLFEELKTLIEKHKYVWHKKIHTSGKHKGYPSMQYLIDWINSVTPMLSDPVYTLATKIYWVLNDIHEFPKCKRNGCNNTLEGKNVTTVTKGYNCQYCSDECMYLDNKTKTVNTCLKRYGVRSVMMTEEFKKQAKKTCLEKYGCEFSSQNKEIQEKNRQTRLKKYNGKYESEEQLKKRKQTMIERYGVEFAMESQEFINKSIETCRERYGVDYPGISEQAIEKKKETCIEKYGVDSYSKTEEFKNKVKTTCIEKYGTENPMSVKEFQDKAKNTCLERYGDKNYNNRESARKTCMEKYGVESNIQRPEILEKMKDSMHKRNYEKLLNNKYAIPLFSYDDFLHKNDKTIFKWKCLKCGTEFEARIDWNFYCKYIKCVARCPTCFPELHGESYQEREFYNFLSSITEYKVLQRQKVLIDNRKGRKNKEIDCYIPELKLGFEYNGIRFHSQEFGCEIDRHLNKTLLAEKQGIKLIHINSLDWRNDMDRIKTLIKRIVSNEDVISEMYDMNSEVITVDRSLFNKCFKINGFELIEETKPIFNKMTDYRKNEYHYPDCGKLIYRKIV